MPEWGAEALSVVALLVSVGVGLLHYFQMNRLQGRLTKIETDRRRDEQMPQFDVAWHNGFLGFRYHGPVEPLDRCVVHFPADNEHVRYPLAGILSRDETVQTEVEVGLHRLNDEVRLQSPPANAPSTSEQSLILEVEALGDSWRVPIRFSVRSPQVW